MIKNMNYYLSIDYDIIVSKLSEEDGGGYFAYYKDIKGVMGDGPTEDEAISDVKNAFKCFLEVALENKDIIPEPIELDKTKRINISMTNRRINSLDLLAKKMKTDRSKILSTLTDMLMNNDIKLKMV